MSVRETAVKGVSRSFGVLIQDLEALPEEAFSKSLGGKARTAADIVYELNMVNDHIGMTIRGEKPFDWPEDDGWITAPAEFSNKETALAAIKESSEKMIKTAEGFSDADMDKAIKTEHGETNIAERLRFVALHNWYHSGQFNYMQTLLGDSEWHWS